MDNGNEKFEVDFENGKLYVEQISMPGLVFFRVNFSNSTPSLTLLRATDINQARFWTSVPEGRHKLAVQIGPLIEQHYQTKPT